MADLLDDGPEPKQLSPREYRDSLKEALGDTFLRKTLDKFAVQYKANREAIFSGLEEKGLIAEVAAMKDQSIDRLEDLYEEFRAEASRKGMRVHLAKTADEAVRTIIDIARESGAKRVIKSKSMTAEEIDLNGALLEASLDYVETDLGEWIIQLRGEGPSHMVLPAIHLSRYQVAEEFAKAAAAPAGPHGDGPVGPGDPPGRQAGGPDRTPDGEDIGKLVKVARRQLRAHFVQADMGITGANFAVAKNGAIGLCTNEGNARLTTNLPGVHVALVGLDKLVPTAADALKVLRILPRNATAQPITTYVSWITGLPPSGQSGSVGSPQKSLHVVFLDNGRLDLAKDPKCREVLRCVRCGACANVCPVYRLVGGHRMGYVYIGAIGLILTYFFHGKEKAKQLVNNCVGCEACKDVCAAGIDLSGIISEIRARISESDGSPAVSKLLGLVMSNRPLFHTLLKYAKFAQKPVATGAYVRHLPTILLGDHGFRALPAIANRSFREAWPEIEAQDIAPKDGPRIALMAGCAHDFIYPDQLVAAVKLIRAKGGRALFPMEQSCCGLPSQMMGERRAAEKTALGNFLAFTEARFDYLVSLCPSCANQMKNRYPTLLAGSPGVSAEALESFAQRVIDFSTLLTQVLKYFPEDFTPARAPNSASGPVARASGAGGLPKVAYHSPCHLGRGLGVTGPPRALIAMAGEYLPTEGEEVCCGFGGTYSLKFPEMSSALMERKLEVLEASGAERLVTDCPGCVLQLRGGEEKRGRRLPVEHLSEFLARSLKPSL